MKCVRVRAASGSFRKSFARSYAETYTVVPPATVYGMLLSLAGERLRSRHEGVRLGFAYAAGGSLNDRPSCRIATTLHKLSRYKYGVASKQEKFGNQPDYVETLCNLDFLCWIDSSAESNSHPHLEERVSEAVLNPSGVDRYGVLCLGRSDDIVDSVDLVQMGDRPRFVLLNAPNGSLELPVWVDHVGSIGTVWARFEFDRTVVHSVSPREECMVTIAPSHR